MLVMELVKFSELNWTFWITNITPTDVPFTSSIRTEKVSGRVFEFQEDTLASAGDNKLVEGGALSAGTQTATNMLTNTTQILSKTFAVSKTADAIKTYGKQICLVA